MSNVSVSPGASSHIGKRNALYKTRGVSPTFKEVLRDRCYLRIKSRRNSLFEQFRNMKGKEDLRSTLSDILHEEVDKLKKEPMELEVIEEVNVDSEVVCLHHNDDKWIIEEYEKVLSEEEALYYSDWDQEVICPLCEKCVLRLNNNGTIRCNKCKIEFPQVPSLKFFRDSLNYALSQHCQTCNDAQFALLSDGSSNSLYLICHTCVFFLFTV